MGLGGVVRDPYYLPYYNPYSPFVRSPKLTPEAAVCCYVRLEIEGLWVVLVIRLSPTWTPKVCKIMAQNL